MKETLSITATVLTFVGYVPYYRDILRGKVQPHIYSWGLWSILTALLVALQIKGGAGSVTLVTITVGILCTGVVILSFKNGKRDITISDKIVAVLALVAMGFWLIADKPIIATLLVVTADMLAFVPTVRKSWNKPYSETLSMYITNTLRFFIALLAVEKYTILSALWIAAWAIGNGLFSIMLLVRRKQLGSK